MESFIQLLPHLWRYRRAWIGAGLTAVAAAALWSGSLLLVYPVVNVLLEGKSPATQVGLNIAQAEDESNRMTAELAVLIAQMPATAPRAGELPSPEHLESLRKEARLRRMLQQHSADELWNRRLQAWVIPWLPRDHFQLLAALMAFLGGLTILRGACTYAQEVLVGVVVTGSLRSIRSQMMRKALQLDYPTMTAWGPSDLMARFTNDLYHLQRGLELASARLLMEPLKLIGCLAAAFYVNWRLTLLSLLTVPFAALVFARFGKRLKKASQRQLESAGRLFQILEEALPALRTVQAYRQERWHRRRFAEEQREYFGKSMRIQRIDALTGPTIELAATAMVCLALLPGAFLVLRGQTAIFRIQLSETPMSIADLAQIYTCLAALVDPLRKLAAIYSKLRKAAAASDRVMALLNAVPQVVDASPAKELPRPTQKIEFRRVTFSYPAIEHDRPPALNDVSFEIPVGEFAVIVGSNGSGKSTLLNLLPRFYDPQQGEILIDGVNLRQIAQRSLRQHLGLVTQETLLLDRSIRDNIRLGCPNAADEDIVSAARTAHVLDFVDRLPHGLDTLVGERGGRLSGGQRQRISLARAIVRDPALLVLDEATSAIDAESEMLIHRALARIAPGRTTLVVTHALTPTLLAAVTKVVVLHRGSLVGCGTHDELLRVSPFYQQLYAAQQTARAA